MNKAALFLVAAFFVISCGDKSADEARDSVKDTTSSSSTNTMATPTGTSSVTPKVFWFDYTEKKTSGDEPVDMGKDEAIQTLQALPVTDGNFFGVDLGRNGIVQFMYNEKNVLLLDIPDPVAMESFQKEITMEQAVKVVSDVYDGKSADDVKEMIK